MLVRNSHLSAAAVPRFSLHWYCACPQVPEGMYSVRCRLSLACVSTKITKNTGRPDGRLSTAVYDLTDSVFLLYLVGRPEG